MSSLIYIFIIINANNIFYVKPDLTFHEFGKERVEIVIDIIGMS